MVKINLHKDQEFVIGGYTEPAGSRKHFGALLVGFYEGTNLKFAGRVGTGFSEKLLRLLFDDLQKIRVESCPFSNPPGPGRNRWDQGLTAAEMKRCRWVKPSMICQVKFTEWTRDDRLSKRCFSALGRTSIRTKWFGKTQTKDLNDRLAWGCILPDIDDSKAVQGYQKLSVRKELRSEERAAAARIERLREPPRRSRGHPIYL